MSILAYTVLGLYCFTLLYVTVYCVMQIKLLYHYRRGLANAMPPTPAQPARKMAMVEEGATAWQDEQHLDTLAGSAESEELPFVTIQLPIFNERFVVERLIDNISQFNYPKDKFEIHVLDDSTDDTVEITRKKVEEYKAKGFQIEQITRTDRKGYKAGALKEGMRFAKGDFIAIFDADFLPKPDFLLKTMPWFRDPSVGVVQTRWEHINEDYSLITRLQAMQLNVHFRVEQVGRMNGNYLLQFNGTAGVWRRQTIEEAGGWEADTLTEDLDLSIRAQLKGWKIRFLENVGSPAELPIEMNSLKSQQFRWMKGGAETAKKMLPTVWNSDLGLGKKIQATIHLLSSTVFVFVFAMGVFSVPLLFLFNGLMEDGFSKDFFAYFLVGLMSIIAVYFAANVNPNESGGFSVKRILKFIFLFPLFLALSMGLSLHNTIAVLEGYRGKKSPFVRTPKFNIKSIRDKLSKTNYLNHKVSWTTILEGVFALYFLVAVLGAIYLQNMIFIAFHLMLFLGYGAIFYYSIRHMQLRAS